MPRPPRELSAPPPERRDQPTDGEDRWQVPKSPGGRLRSCRLARPSRGLNVGVCRNRQRPARSPPASPPRRCSFANFRGAMAGAASLRAGAYRRGISPDVDRTPAILARERDGGVQALRGRARHEDRGHLFRRNEKRPPARKSPDMRQMLKDAKREVSGFDTILLYDISRWC